jgi:propionyl-CoA synthetase
MRYLLFNFAYAWGTLFAVVQDYKVTTLSTAPTALRAVRRDDPDAKLMRKYDLSSLRALFLAGERSEPTIISRYQRLLDELAAPGAIVDDKLSSRSFLYFPNG